MALRDEYWQGQQYGPDEYKQNQQYGLDSRITVHCRHLRPFCETFSTGQIGNNDLIKLDWLTLRLDTANPYSDKNQNNVVSFVS